MNDTKYIGQALPLIASMLGNKLGVKVQTRGGETACTDGDTIYIPPLPMDGNEEMLGLVNGYIDHEAAHIRFTDFHAAQAAGLSPTGLFIWNAIEDWRVEHELVKRYPGCRSHLNWIIRHLFMEKDGLSPSFSILNYILLTLRSWDVPELTVQCDEQAAFIDGIWPSLRCGLDALLGGIPDNCHSTNDSITFARSILYLLEDALQKGNDSPKDEAQNSDEQQSPQGQEENSDDRHRTAENVRDGGQEAIGQSLLKACLEATPSELPESFDEKLSAQLSSSINPLDSMFIAVENPMQTERLSEYLLERIQRASRALGVRLQALLQAQTLKQSSIGRRGRINGHSLYRLSVANPWVFLQQEPVEEIDTAVHILLDSSASMIVYMDLATSACYAVATALMRISGISVGITAFPSERTADWLPTVFPLLRHGEKLRPLNVQANGSTPLAEALCWVASQMSPLKQQRKIILLITDGDPDNIPLATQTIRQLQARNFEIGGIGIQSRALEHLLPSSESISTLDELAPALYRILHEKLVIRR